MPLPTACAALPMAGRPRWPSASTTCCRCRRCLSWCRLSASLATHRHPACPADRRRGCVCAARCLQAPGKPWSRARWIWRSALAATTPTPAASNCVRWASWSSSSASRRTTRWRGWTRCSTTRCWCTTAPWPWPTPLSAWHPGTGQGLHRRCRCGRLGGDRHGCRPGRHRARQRHARRGRRPGQVAGR